jgi:hypothetical protein
VEGWRGRSLEGGLGGRGGRVKKSPVTTPDRVPHHCAGEYGNMGIWENTKNRKKLEKMQKNYVYLYRWIYDLVEVGNFFRYDSAPGTAYGIFG